MQDQNNEIMTEKSKARHRNYERRTNLKPAVFRFSPEDFIALDLAKRPGETRTACVKRLIYSAIKANPKPG